MLNEVLNESKVTETSMEGGAALAVSGDILKHTDVDLFLKVQIFT